MTLPDLTVKDRIQLHLFDFNRFADAFDVPVEVTQQEIAKAVGIRATHVPQYVRPLITDGLVEERTAHILRQKRRRKVYFLLPKGRTQVAALRASLLEEVVPLRRRNGDVEQVPLSQVYHEDRHGATLSQLLQEVHSVGHVLEVSEPAKGRPVDFTDEAPKIERFYGRAQELAAVRKGLSAARMIVVTGMAGLGKTTLGAKICEEFRGTRSLFWRQIRPWDSTMDLASRFALFLKALGRSELYALVMGRGSKEIGRLEEPLAADLAGTSALIMFDDAHNASHEALMFLSLLLRALKRQAGTSAIVLSRTVPTFYSRREVAVEHAVAELALPALDPTSSDSILADSGVAGPVRETLVKASGGNPLFLRLLASGGSEAAAEGAWSTVEAYIAEEIEPSLGDDERRCMQLGSLYELPVPPQGFLREADVSTRTLQGLRRKGLVTDLGPDRYAIHDSVRGYFQLGLSGDRRSALALLAVPWLLGEADKEASDGRPHDALAYLGNALTIEGDSARRLSILERIGDLRRLAGDFQGAVEAFRTALHGTTDPRARARFHQKVAAVLGLLGELADADRETEAGLALVPPEPSLERAWLVVRRAGIAQLRDDYGALAEHLDRALSWKPVLPADKELWGTVANLRGLLHLMDAKRSDFSLAKSDFEEAIAAFHAAGDVRGLYSAYNNRGLAYLHLGKIENALADLDMGCKIADTAGSLPGRELALFSKAFCLVHYLGDFEEAEKLYEETYRINKAIQRRHKLLWHSKYFADLYRFQGRYDEARESLAYFLEKSHEMVGPAYRLEYLCLLARLCVRCNDPDAAESYLREALEIARGHDLAKAKHHVEWARADLIASRGDMERAAEAYEEALRASPEFDRGEFLVEYGRFLASAGKSDQARDVLSLATENFKNDPRKPLEDAARQVLRSLDSASS